MPDASAKTALLSLLGLGVIALAFYLAVRFAPPAMLQTVVVQPPVCTVNCLVTPL